MRTIIVENKRGRYFARTAINQRELYHYFNNENHTNNEIRGIFYDLNFLNSQSENSRIIVENYSKLVEYTKKTCNYFKIDIVSTDIFKDPEIFSLFNILNKDGYCIYEVKQSFYKIYSKDIVFKDSEINEMKNKMIENMKGDITVEKEVEYHILSLINEVSKDRNLYDNTIYQIIIGNPKSIVASEYTDKKYYNIIKKLYMKDLRKILGKYIQLKKERK